MGWIRLSDDFYDNGKMSDVGPLGVALHVAAMGFCNRNLSDGYFKKNKARLLLDFDGIGVTTASGEMFTAGVDGDEAARLVIDWMVAADLWHECGHDCADCHAREDGGEPGLRQYLIHDYLKYQPSRAEVEKKAAETRERVAKWRAEQENRRGNSVGNSVTNGVRTDAVTHGVRGTPNPIPSPSKKGGRETVDTRGLDADGLPPRTCPDHPNGTGDRCGWCKDYRIKHDAAAASRKDDELDAKRRQKEARENCPRCEGTNTYEDAAGKTRKCIPHQEVSA